MGCDDFDNAAGGARSPAQAGHSMIGLPPATLPSRHAFASQDRFGIRKRIDPAVLNCLIILMTTASVLAHAFTGCCDHQLQLQTVQTAQAFVVPVTAERSLCGCSHHACPQETPANDPQHPADHSCEHLPCLIVVQLEQTAPDKQFASACSDGDVDRPAALDAPLTLDAAFCKRPRHCDIPPPTGPARLLHCSWLI